MNDNRMRPRRLGRLRRLRHANRGQAIIELMLFFSLLVFMVLGATDISTLLDDHLNIVYAARTGARVGSVMGANQFADCAIIGAVQAALASNHNVRLNQIHIYKADPSGQKISNGSGGFIEELYPGSTTCVSSAPNSGAVSNPPTVNNWPYSTPRNTTPYIEDSIGVQLDYTYTFAFQPLGGSGLFSSSDSAVMPMEVVINQNATPTPTPGGP